MSRNLKPEYIRKMINTPAPNDYKFDIANYLYNPRLDCDYPSFKRKIAEDEKTETYRRVYYYKHYDGGGEYMEEVYTVEKNGDTWQFSRNHKEKTLAAAPRFSVKTLLTFCE